MNHQKSLRKKTESSLRIKLFRAQAV